MITRRQTWEALTDDERFSLFTRTELQRDNAVEYARELSGKNAEIRQNAEVRRLMEVGRKVTERSAA